MGTGNEKPVGTELLKKFVYVLHMGKIEAWEAPPRHLSTSFEHLCGILRCWRLFRFQPSSAVWYNLENVLCWFKQFSCAPYRLIWVWTFIWHVPIFPQPWPCDLFSCLVSCPFYFSMFCKPCLLPESELCGFLVSSVCLCWPQPSRKPHVVMALLCQHHTALRGLGCVYLEGCGTEVSTAPLF